MVDETAPEVDVQERLGADIKVGDIVEVFPGTWYELARVAYIQPDESVTGYFGYFPGDSGQPRRAARIHKTTSYRVVRRES